METKSENYLKKRKFYLVLPLLIFPFLTLTFWAMGGGKGITTIDEPSSTGINKELPDAQIEESALDKMSLYSNRLEEEADTLGEKAVASNSVDETWEGFLDEENFDSYASYSDHEDSERQLRRRITELERTIAMQEMTADAPFDYQQSESDASLKRLEEMMLRMSEPSLPDPELQVLDGMLEKIMDIQHPDRVQEKIRERSVEKRGVVYPVANQSQKNVVSMLHRTSFVPQRAMKDTPAVDGVHSEASPESERAGNGFFNVLAQNSASRLVRIFETPGIAAVVHETKTVVTGSNLKLRLIDDIYVNGIRIPAGNFLTGICDLSNERLQVKVSGIQYGNYQLPISLTVFDTDGVEGINIPGAISRDAAKEGSDQAMQSLQFMSMDPSLLAQATGAGIEAAKGLFSRKIRLVKGTVKAGHPILLYDAQANSKN